MFYSFVRKTFTFLFMTFLSVGQFVHRSISIYKQNTNKKDQIIGHLRIKEPGFTTMRLRSVLVRKPDEITGKREFCWNVRSRLEKIFDKSVEEFYIQDIMQTWRFTNPSWQFICICKLTHEMSMFFEKTLFENRLFISIKYAYMNKNHVYENIKCVLFLSIFLWILRLSYVSFLRMYLLCMCIVFHVMIKNDI